MCGAELASELAAYERQPSHHQIKESPTCRATQYHNRFKLSSTARLKCACCMRNALTWPPRTILSSLPTQYRCTACTDSTET